MRKLHFLLLSLLVSLGLGAQEQAVRFAFITDSHIGSAANNEDLLSCIEDINSLKDSLDFVLMGGDLTDFGTDKQLSTAKELLDKHEIPYWIVSGNHDSKWSESGCNTFSRLFGYEQFEFEAGGYRFLGCSSGPDMRMTPALVPRNSMNWLKSLERGKPVIFLNHYPLNDEMINWFEVRRELLRLDCRYAIAGHMHVNEALDYFGLPGMTGQSTYKDKTCAGYNIFCISGGVLSISLRTLNPGGHVTAAPWTARELVPVSDMLCYDADGLPEGFKFMRYTDNASYPQVKLLWAVEEDANIGSGFVREGNLAWYATAAGKVVNMSLADGVAVWTRQLSGKIFGTPALSGGILVVPCCDGSIYAFDAATGAERWKFATGKAIVASPAIYGGEVYVGGSDECFRALRLKDGKLLWCRSGVPGFCDGAPYVDKKQLLFTTWSNRLFSLNPRTGALQWVWSKDRSAFFSPGSCTPIKVGDRVFLVCPDRRTYCCNALSGELLFVVDGGRESFALSEDGKTLYVKRMDGKVIAFDPSIPLSRVNGVIADDSPSKWSGDPGVPVMDYSEAKWIVDSGTGRDIGSSALAVCGNLLLIPGGTGLLHALDNRTGKFLWKQRIGISLVNPVTAWTENGKICILASTMDGKVERLEVGE